MEPNTVDKKSILVGIELEKENIPYSIFYRGVIIIEKTLNSHFNLADKYSDNLLKLEELKIEIVKEISLIEANIESNILWIICVNSFWKEEEKNKLRNLFVEAGFINSLQDERIMILKKELL